MAEGINYQGTNCPPVQATLKPWRFTLSLSKEAESADLTFNNLTLLKGTRGEAPSARAKPELVS